MRLDIVYLIWNMESRYLESEVGGLSSTGKSFRVVRACARCVCLVSSGQKSLGGGFPFSLLGAPAFPFSLGIPPLPPSSYPTLVGFICIPLRGVPIVAPKDGPGFLVDLQLNDAQRPTD